MSHGLPRWQSMYTPCAFIPNESTSVGWVSVWIGHDMVRWWCREKAGAYGKIVYSAKKAKNATLFKEKLMLAEAQEAAFKTEDLDAYDSDCDDSSSAKAVLMANLSRYDLEVLSEVPYFDSYLNNVINQDVQEIQYSEQTHIDDFQDNEIHSDSNIIPYSQYLQESQNVVIHDTYSFAPNDLLVLSLVDQMADHVAHLDKENQANRMEETLILEEESRSKMLDKQNYPISIEKRIKISPIYYSKLNKINEDFGKHFVTQKELSAEQAFWLKHSSFFETPVMSHTPLRIEAPSELSKKDIDEIETMNIEPEHSVEKLLLENENLRKEREHLKSVYKDQFDSIRKTRVQSKEHCDSVIAQINAKSVKNSDLNAQLQEKVFAITALKNELRKLKEKNVVDTAVSIPNATIAPGMIKLDIEPISHRLNNNSIEGGLDLVNHDIRLTMLNLRLVGYLGFSNNEKQETDNSRMAEALAALETTLKTKKKNLKKKV
nr:hypothetical protein [Tanacetum cinerariifolium]